MRCTTLPPFSSNTRMKPAHISWPASVLLRSFRYCTSARSMSMPPEASGPVLTVIKPRRIGVSCADAHRGSPSEATPAAWMNLLRLNGMFLLLQLFEKLLVGDHPAEAARNVLQSEDVQVIAVHARHAIGQHHHAVIEVERSERRIQYASIGVDSHQDESLGVERAQQLPEIRPIETIQALLVL